MSSTLLRLEGVTRSYEGPPRVQALRGVNLLIERGESVAIQGPSGSGKSTLLNILGLLDRPDGGIYEFVGMDAMMIKKSELAKKRAELIGFVFQQFHLIPYRSAIENVEVGLLYKDVPRQERRPRAREALEQVGLLPRADGLARDLSGGEQQRVAIARAIVGSPTLLLCDEPTGNLDSRTSGTLLDLFDRLHAEFGLTTITITHDRDVAARFCRSVTMHDGQVI